MNPRPRPARSHAGPLSAAVLLEVLLAVALCAPFIQAQEEATITVKKSDTLNISIKPFAGPDAAIAGKVVSNDLDLSGLFSIGIPERANFIVSATASGGSLQGVVTDNRGSVVLQKTYSGNIRQCAHQFSDDIVETLTGTKGIATSKIAFVSNRSGTKEIYTADYDGANAVQVTRDGAISVSPAISPDGRRIAYTGYQSGYADIYLKGYDELHYLSLTPYHSYKAMQCHHSQYVWFRKLFTLFSRYAYCNSFALYANNPEKYKQKGK